MLQLHSHIFYWMVNYSTELGYRNMHPLKTNFAPHEHPMLVSFPRDAIANEVAGRWRCLMSSREDSSLSSAAFPVYLMNAVALFADPSYSSENTKPRHYPRPCPMLMSILFPLAH